MITKERIMQLVVQHATQQEGYHNMIASMFTPEIIGEMGEDQLIIYIKSLTFEYKETTVGDDDQYYMSNNPADGQYYVWSCTFGGDWPTTPVYIETSCPKWFNVA